MLAHETTSRNYIRKRFVSCLSHLASGKLLKITPFHTQRPRNYKICLSGQKILSYHICYENLAKYLRVKRQNDRQAKVLRLFSVRTEQYACKEERIK